MQEDTQEKVHCEAAQAQVQRHTYHVSSIRNSVVGDGNVSSSSK